MSLLFDKFIKNIINEKAFFKAKNEKRWKERKGEESYK